MKTCPKCGNTIQNESSKFCRKCGTNVANVQVENNEDSDFSTSNDTDQPLDSNQASSNNHYPFLNNDSEVKNSSSIITNNPKDYMVWAILTTLFCCVPAGIYAIICSSKVDKYYRAGNTDKAFEQSKKTKRWVLISAILGFIFAVLYSLILLFVYSGNEKNSNINNNTNNSELQERRDDHDPPTESENILKRIILKARKELPVSIDKGMTLTDIEVNETYVIYRITCDEDLIDINLINKKEAKVNIIKMLKHNNSDDLQHFLNWCKQAEKGISYSYKGNQTGTSMTVHISPEDLF